MNIGFNVWDKKEKRMIESPAEEDLFLSGNGNLINIKDPMIYLMDRYIVLFSTCLLDKSKKESYTGDIIRVPSDCGIVGGCKDCGSIHSPEWHEVIKFGKFKNMYEDDNEKLFGFYVENYDRGKKTYPLIPSLLKECFIVGNIYENPELLEVKK